MKERTCTVQGIAWKLIHRFSGALRGLDAFVTACTNTAAMYSPTLYLPFLHTQEQRSVDGDRYMFTPSVQPDTPQMRTRDVFPQHPPVRLPLPPTHLSSPLSFSLSPSLSLHEQNLSTNE